MKAKQHFLIALSCFALMAKGSTPELKIDLNYYQVGRDYTAAGYIAWETSLNEALSVNGMTFTVENAGDIGSLRSHWYKQGITEGNLLVCDGLKVDGANAGAQILLNIAGLPTGKHSLLIYLNNVDNLEAQGGACPMDILINDELIIDNIQPTVRALTPYEAQKAFVTFNVASGEEVKILLKADVSQSNGKTNNNILLNAIELNAPNAQDQAKNPFPQDLDEHIELSNGAVTLSWTADDEAVTHDVYFSENKSEVENATALVASAQNNTDYAVSDLNTHDYYYWRVDERKADGTLTKGNIWTFRAAQAAFPGAEGYGRFARGGRGGKVVHVTNLSDDPSNPAEGSLRHAIEKESGPRTIVFDVSGIIALKGRLSLSDDYVTIAGQTAPGKGICIKNAPFGLSGANDVIMQHIRVRRGDEGDYGWGLDGTGMAGCYNSIIDHCSVSWTIDEAFSSRNGGSLSLQRTLISEALSIAGHPNYDSGTDHGYAATIGGNIGSFHHNLLAHNSGRNWSLGGGLDGNGYYAGRLDIRNNVVYNWKSRTTDGGAMEVNFVNNYYKAGPSTQLFYTLTMEHEGTGKGTQRAYYSGNELRNHSGEDKAENHTTSEGIAGRRYRIRNNALVDWETWVDEPFFESHVSTQTAKAAYKNVLSDVACISPVMDEHDQRIINETLNGTYKYSGSVSGKAGLIDSQKDAGGWEAYPEETRPVTWDTDRDGMPNWWEEYYGHNPDTNDAGEINQDGYSNLEHYLHWASNKHYIQSSQTPLEIDLSTLFAGYVLNPQFAVVTATDGTATINGNKITLSPKDKNKPYIASFTIRVSDNEGDTMERTVGVFFFTGEQNSTHSPLSRKFKVFPTLADDYITIDSNNANEEIQIINTAGIVVRHLSTGTHQTTIDVKELTAGHYFIKSLKSGKILRFIIDSKF